MTPEILYEDNHIIAVDKPAGILTQGDATGRSNLLDEIKVFIKKRDSKPGNVFLGMVQRLDLPVSGVILFAKTSKAASRISEQIRKKKLTKFYLAVTTLPNKKVEEGRWCNHSAFLVRVKDKTEVVSTKRAGAQDALLRRKTLFTNKNYGIHLIELVTGRKHQIRAQLADEKMVLVGDVKYGARTSLPTQDTIGLHACMCSFVHPTTKKTITLHSKLPDLVLDSFTGVEAGVIKNKIKQELYTKKWQPDDEPATSFRKNQAKDCYSV